MTVRACVLALLCWCVGLVGQTQAWAQRSGAGRPVRPVRIESEPAGATVYLGDKETEPLGTTPLDTTLPLGEAILIVTAPFHVDAFEAVRVEKPKRREPKRLVLRYQLTRARGFLSVPGPVGAQVFIDDEPAATRAPLEVDVDAGPHQVKIVHLDHPPFVDQVDVIANEVTEVTAAFAARDTAPARPGRVAPARPPRAPARPGRLFPDERVVIDVGLRLASRRYAYTGARPFLLPLPEARTTGLALAVGWAPASTGVARHLAIGLEADLGIPVAVDTGDGLTLDGEASTRWWAARLGGRLRLPVGPIDVGLGIWLGRRAYGFAADGDLAMRLPDVTYDELSPRVTVAWPFGRRGAIEPYAYGEARWVLGTGALASRFTGGAKALGWAGGAGLRLRLADGAWQVGLDLEHARYGWTFAGAPTDVFYAAGATDVSWAGNLGLGAGF